MYAESRKRFRKIVPEEEFCMGLGNVKEGKLLYHLTEVKNMESIIQFGLLPRIYLSQHEMKFEDVADWEILEKRRGLGLDAYVPFHFHPYSAFDVAVKNAHPQEQFVYICIKRALAEFNNFQILPIHPLSQESYILYDYEEGMRKIDWETMKRRNTIDTYSRNVKMAECLTKKKIPAELIQCIYVPDMKVKQYIEELLWENEIREQPPYVNIQEKWFQLGE